MNNAKNMKNNMKAIIVAVLLASVIACDSAADISYSTQPGSYQFVSRNDASKSSVSYTGQLFRHVLIKQVKSVIDQQSKKINSTTAADAYNPANATEFKEDFLDVYYEFKAAVKGADPLPITTTPGLAESNFNAISSKGSNLKGKVAGNDKTGQYKDWSSSFVGWSGLATNSPEGFILKLFTDLSELMHKRSLPTGTGTTATPNTIENEPGTGTGTTGTPITKHYVDVSGIDYQQLIEKFMTGAIAWSQGADDYMDNDLDGKGINSDNTAQAKGKNYTALEHVWDEAFGYFGAAINYIDYTDDELSGKSGRDAYKKAYNDFDGDGSISIVKGEYNFGHSVNAAKRDRGAAKLSATDFSTDAWNAFIRGRTLIAAAGGALTADQMAELVSLRDAALNAWEKAIAASAVHYVNDTLQDMNKFGNADYSFIDHAKHWSELKGFALCLQFRRDSPLKPEDFKTLHDKIGVKPVLTTAPDAEKNAYKVKLREARSILQIAYGFAAKNMGDDNGENGW